MNQTHSEWDICPPDTFLGMVQTARVRRQRRWAYGSAASVVLGVTLVAVVIAVNTDPPKIGCSEALQLMAAYHRGDLSRREIRQVDYHLGKCTHCKDHFDTAKQSGRGTSRVLPVQGVPTTACRNADADLARRN